MKQSRIDKLITKRRKENFLNEDINNEEAEVNVKYKDFDTFIV